MKEEPEKAKRKERSKGKGGELGKMEYVSRIVEVRCWQPSRSLKIGRLHKGKKQCN